MMTSTELLLQNKIAQLETRLQRAERQEQHNKVVLESMRARVMRTNQMVLELTNRVLPILEAVQETIAEPPTISLKEACFAHSMQHSGSVGD